jgi:GxxExxY protein
MVMPYEQEEPPIWDQSNWEPDAELNSLSKAVIGAAIEVHNRLGPGLDEASYQNALAIEFGLKKISFRSQVNVKIEYKGEVVGTRRLDFLVANRLVVEIKAVEQLLPLHKAQVYTYLKITKLHLGLLLNFDVITLKEGIIRIIRS